MPVMNVLLGDMNYTLGINEGNTFLRLAGNLGGGNLVRLGVIFQRGLNQLRGRFFLSLRGCQAIDSQVLAFLAQQQKSILGAGRALVLVDVPSQILKVLEDSSFAALCEVIPSLAEAEKKYGQIFF